MTHSNASTHGRQAGYTAQPRAKQHGTRDDRRQGRDCRRTGGKGTSGGQFGENYPKRYSPDTLTPIKRRP